MKSVATGESSVALQSGRILNKFNRAAIVDENFCALMRQLAESAGGPGGLAAGGGGLKGNEVVDAASGLTANALRELFESMTLSRHMDLEARRMRARGEGFYTIGSAGHECNAVLGRLSDLGDMLFLHYRSGGLMVERARKASEIDIVRDTMLSFAASAEDPASGGRHKVWGSLRLNVPPQTSTIASHLPKAVGTAMAIHRSARLKQRPDWPDDRVVLCNFGDASANHAASQTAFNAASWAAHQRLPVPILFICEDNGLGISVPTPPGWIEAAFSHRHGLRYFKADGLDLIETYRVAKEALEHCRTRRAPVFLHLTTVRLLGHAGSDPETEYHTFEQIEAAEVRDPLLLNAQRLVELGIVAPDGLLGFYEMARERVAEAAAKAAARPKLDTSRAVMAPLAPYHPEAVAKEAARRPEAAARIQVFGGEDKLPEASPPRHMAILINNALADLLALYPEAIIFGEDVAKKGGVYHVTAGLTAKFGPRVFNTLLDETMILGMGIGSAHQGLLPIPEIQYLAYVHNAEDQLRGEASSLQYFSNGQFTNPMVVRIAGWSYQKGFGGHFHNDNSVAALRDIPGLVLCTPSRGDDAARMLRTCAALAKADGRVCVFLEPIALYMMKDLYAPGDGLWQFPYPPPGEAITLGAGEVYHPEGRDLTILTFANGVHMSLRAARALQAEKGVEARVVDLRWLNPLNGNLIEEQARATGRVLVVDEGRRTGGVAEAILALLHERVGGQVAARRLNAMDTFIPLGPAADLIQPTEEAILRAADEFLQR